MPFLPVLPVTLGQESKTEEQSKPRKANSYLKLIKFKSEFDNLDVLPMYNAPLYPWSTSSGVFPPLLT